MKPVRLNSYNLGGVILFTTLTIKELNKIISEYKSEYELEPEPQQLLLYLQTRGHKFNELNKIYGLTEQKNE